MKMTKHARQRIHEREGAGKGKAERRALLALERGYTVDQTKGKLRKWLDFQWEYNRTADGMRVYGDKLYVFTGSILITVLPIPSDMKHNIKDFIRRRDG